MENDYKRYKFANILNESVEQENLKLRQQLGSLQEIFESKELVYNGVLDQLKAAQKHNLTLEKAARLEKATYELREHLKNTSRRKKKPTSSLQDKEWTMELDHFGAEQGYTGANGVHELDTFSAPFVDSALFHGHNRDEGNLQQPSGRSPSMFN